MYAIGIRHDMNAMEVDILDLEGVSKLSHTVGRDDKFVKNVGFSPLLVSSFLFLIFLFACLSLRLSSAACPRVCFLGNSPSCFSSF